MHTIETNCTTNESVITPFTDKEIAAHKQKQITFEKEAEIAEAEITTKEAARAALLDKLGITADEAKLLLS